MAVPIAGTNAGSLQIKSASSGAYNKATTINGLCVDNTGTYGYTIISAWQGVATTLNGTITSGATSVILTSASAYAPSGYVRITTDAGAQMIVAYTSITSNTLNGCTGVTATCTSGNAVIQCPALTKIQLSNLTAVGGVASFYPLQISPANNSYPFYDDANSLICYVGNDNKLYSIPAAGGSLPFTPIQVGAGAITPLQGGWVGLTYDPTIGIVWNASTANGGAICGFWYKDPTGVNADFTNAYHPFTYYTGTTLTFMSSNDSVAWTPGALRMTVSQGNNNSFANVVRWRADQYRTSILADSAGATNSTSNGATPGTAIANPTSMVYDNNGRLYATSGMSLYNIDPVNETTISGPVTLAGTTAVITPRYMPTGGFASVGNGQLAYLATTGGTLFIAY